MIILKTSFIYVVYTVCIIRSQSNDQQKVIKNCILFKRAEEKFNAEQK